MARQSSIITVRGKIGNVVGMKNGFGTPSGPFIREYVTDKKNPQTDFQMDQRAKMLPAVLFRRQLEKVIARAWEGKKYGGPSIREFMKYALKEPWTNVPQLYKDETKAVPGQYLISRGSLPSLEYSLNSEGTTLTIQDIDLGSFDLSQRTFGNLSKLFNNAGYTQNGDQLTFIKIEQQGTAGFRYLVESFFVDESDDREWQDILSVLPFNGFYNGNSVTIPNGGKLFFGFAVVISREGNSSYQRSTQRMVVVKELLGDYFGTTLSTDVAESYRAKKGTNSIDWPYEDEEVPAATEEDALFTLTGLTGDRATLNGSQVRIRRKIDGQQPTAVYVTEVKPEESYGGQAPFVVSSIDEPLVYRDSNNDSYYLQLTNVTALSSLRQISVD